MVSWRVSVFWCKMSNQEATGRVLDTLSYKELRGIVSGHVHHVMSKQQYVSARGAMRAQDHASVEPGRRSAEHGNGTDGRPR